MDLVRASSRSPSFLGGGDDACVGWCVNSEVDDLDEDADRDISSLGSKDPFALYMAKSVAFLSRSFTYGVLLFLC